MPKGFWPEWHRPVRQSHIRRLLLEVQGRGIQRNLEKIRCSRSKNLDRAKCYSKPKRANQRWRDTELAFGLNLSLRTVPWLARCSTLLGLRQRHGVLRERVRQENRETSQH